MKYNFTKIIILMTLIFFSCVPSIIPEPPKWINSIDNNSDKIIQSVGIGENEYESIFHALINISEDGNEWVISDEKVNSSVSSFSFGKVDISSSAKSVKSEDGDEWEFFGNLIFNDGNKSMRYEIISKEVNDKTVIHDYEIILQNCSFNDLINELNSDGCSFEFYSDDNNHYTLINYEKKRFLEKFGYKK